MSLSSDGIGVGSLVLYAVNTKNRNEEGNFLFVITPHITAFMHLRNLYTDDGTAEQQGLTEHA